MKRTKSIYAAIALSLCGLVFFVSCKKDEDGGSRELLVFMKGEYGSPDNVLTASITQTPTAVWGNTEFEIPVFATREVPKDVIVTVAASDDLVDDFNEATKRKAVLLPAANYQVASYQVKISAGSNESEPVRLNLVNGTSLTDTNGYVLPLTITKVEGEDRGVRVSTNLATAYLYIPYKYTNVDSVQAPLAGTPMSRTGWSATVSNTTSGAPATNLLDGNNTTAWRSSNTATAAKWVVINMGAERTIKSFLLVPNYVATAENATQITVSTSSDNVTFKVQGIWKGTGPATGSSATNPDIKGVNFIAPVTARYFRFDITSWVSGARVGIAEINALQ